MEGAGEGDEVLRRGCIERRVRLCIFSTDDLDPLECTASEEKVQIFLDERESQHPIEPGGPDAAYVAESNFIPIQTRSTSTSRVQPTSGYKTLHTVHRDRTHIVRVLAAHAAHCLYQSPILLQHGNRLPRVRHPEAQCRSAHRHLTNAASFLPFPFLAIPILSSI